MVQPLGEAERSRLVEEFYAECGMDGRLESDAWTCSFNVHDLQVFQKKCGADGAAGLPLRRAREPLTRRGGEQACAPVHLLARVEGAQCAVGGSAPTADEL